MADFADYMAEGVAAMSAARDSVSRKWQSEWKQGAIDYGLAQQANANEINMWQMQQDYNTPAAQMARLKEAGLNPNLAYQMANTGNASSAPGVHKSEAPNITAGQNARVQNAMAIVNGVVGVLESIQNLTGKAYDMDFQRMRNEQARMQLDVDRKLFETVGHPMDISSGAFGFEGRFMPKAYAMAYKNTLLPFQMEWQGLRNTGQKFMNDNIMPLQRDLLSGRVDALGYANRLTEYNAKLMETMDPRVRMLWGVLTQGLGTLAKFKYW